MLRTVLVTALAALPLGACNHLFPFDLTAPADGAADAGPRDADGAADAPRPDGAPVDGTAVDHAVPLDGPPADGPPADAQPADAPPAPDLPPPDAGTTVPGSWTTALKGTFLMGAPTSEPCAGSVSGPQETQHSVTLGHDLLIQTTEVTQGQFQQVMGYNPSKYQGCAACPVEQVSWHEAAAYCNALSDLAQLARCYTEVSGNPCGTMTPCLSSDQVCIKGACRSYAPDPAYAVTKIHTCPGYRLPTEAEWENAYRAKTTSAYYSGANNGALCTVCDFEAPADQIGWYCKNSGQTTHPAGQKQANAWGLFDMAGNVYEWCHDCYLADLGSLPQTDPDPTCPPTLRSLRGGSHLDQARKIRAANRYGAAPQTASDRWGFRCVRTK